MKITIVAGARPNFMKIAPIIKAIRAEQQNGNQVSFRLVHTGQHYDKKMSGDFFEQLGIPEPDINLECGGGTQAEQTAGIMVKFEVELLENRPDIVLVVGDVTSTMSCAITAKKLCIDVAHVEAGIRSGDMTMPEEINRIVTDSITDHFFTTTTMANDLLSSQQVPKSRIHYVGNTMIDTLFQNINKIKRPSFWEKFALKENEYFILTLHRPSNVDDPQKLIEILDALIDATQDFPVIFPVHPRTRQTMENLKIADERLILAEPQAYLEFIYMIKYAKGIITDSGGVTEEATVLHIPCLTLRNSTERPETVTLGTNELIGEDLSKLKLYIEKIIEGKWRKGSIPKYWDGHTSERIIKELLSAYSASNRVMHKV